MNRLIKIHCVYSISVRISGAQAVVRMSGNNFKKHETDVLKMEFVILLFSFGAPACLRYRVTRQGSGNAHTEMDGDLLCVRQSLFRPLALL